MAAEDFLLKWNDHHSLFFAGLEALYQEGEHSDVVISAGSRVFRAHKLVLSLCSPYFQNLFRKLGPEKHVIFLKDISASHLELLLEYMYQGEIKVREEELVTVLNVAQSLEIRGLTDSSDSKQQTSSSSSSHQTSSSASLPRQTGVPPPPGKRKSPPPPPSLVQTAKKARPLEQQQPPHFAPSSIKMEQDPTPVIDIEEDLGDEGGGYHHPGVGGGHGYQGAGILAKEEDYEGYEEGYDQEGAYFEDQGAHGDKVEEFVSENAIRMWRCKICTKTSNIKCNMLRHVLTHTGDKPFSCRFCYTAFSVSSNRLRHEKNCKFSLPQ